MQGGQDHSDAEHQADGPPKKVKRRRGPETPVDPEEALRLKAEAARIAAEVFASAEPASAAHEGDEAPIKVRPCITMSASRFIVLPGTRTYRSGLLGCPEDSGRVRYCGGFASSEPAADAADVDEAAPKVRLL